MPTVYSYPVTLTIADLIRAKSICSQTQFSHIIYRLLTSLVRICTPFEQLTLSDKHTLISLTVFSSGRISKDAAVDVISDEIGVVKAVGSLKTLVNKSLIDEDPCGEYYSIHPLIHSFVVDKAKQSDFKNVFQSSRILFCRYSLL